MLERPGIADAAPTGPDTPNTGPAVTRLCRLIRAGDRDAFTALYNAWYERWLREARVILGRDHALQYDIVQEAFLRVIRKLPPLESEGALSAWMCRALRSSAMDLLRAEHRRALREARLARHESAKAKGEVQEHVWLLECLALLEAQDQDLLRARVVQGVTLEQAGRAVGVTGDAAHGRIRRALARLRDALGGSHE